MVYCWCARIVSGMKLCSTMPMLVLYYSNSFCLCFYFTQIEDAVDGVGGWGESQAMSRIKERRIVLCLDNSKSTYTPGAAGGNAGAASGGSSNGSSSSSAAQTTGKVKFRKLNNGAGTCFLSYFSI